MNRLRTTTSLGAFLGKAMQEIAPSGRLLLSLVAVVVTAAVCFATPAFADPFFLSTGTPDGLLGALSQLADSVHLETETADDFVLSATTSLAQATIVGMIPPGTTLENIGNVEIEVYRVFPNDSINPPSGNVPSRVNSPADVEIDDATRDWDAGTLDFTTTLLNPSFPVANSVVDGINKVPNSTTSGEGQVTGEVVEITITFIPPILLPAGHYFLRPEVQVNGGEFLYLSVPKPIVAPGTPFAGDLQAWIRNANLKPDWLRIGTDIIGGNPPTTFNMTFSLTGESAPTCVGDCDDNDAVTVDEVVNGVNIALGTLPLDQCPRFDCNLTGEVTVDCILSAIAAALNGCPAAPTSTPTQNIATATPTGVSTPIATSSPTRTSMVAPTATPTPTGITTAANTPSVTATTTTAVCGTFLGKFGSQGSGPGQFLFPEAVAVDQAGNIFVADTGHHRVEKFTSTGSFLLQWGSMGSADGQFQDPQGIAVDQAGDVFVTDLNNNRVQKFDNDGTFLFTWGTAGNGDGQFSGPVGIAVDENGNVFVVDRFNNRIQKFTDTGTFLTKWGTVGSGDGQFGTPTGVAVDGNHNVYVADLFNNRIQKFTDTGIFLTKWGTTGSGDGQFVNAKAVAVDGNGNVFAVDDGHDRIEVFTDTGTFLAEWGSLGPNDGQFNAATAVAVNVNGEILVTEQGNRVQRFACSP